MDKKSWLHIGIFYLNFILIMVFNHVVHASEQAPHELELSAIASLASAAMKNDEWHSVIPVIGNKNQYYVATKAGKIYQLQDNEIAKSAFFDLKLAINNPNILALTAITLDPSFNYRDRDGYHTFYTAHTEPSKASKKKISPSDTTLNLPYDAVLMRWQVTLTPNQAPKISKQSEVMRIGVAQANEHIQQLSFNPYVESWHDNYGLLFISLSKSTIIKNQALYAGAILRIKPYRHGLRNYTIPDNNPFTSNADILNEIVFIAGENTEHFDWIKKSSHSLIVQLNQENADVLVQANVGEDWRQSIPQAQIKQQLPPATAQDKTLLYHGRELKDLWGKFLHLQQQNNVWQLQASMVSSVLGSEINGETKVSSPAHRLANYNAEKQARFSLHQRHNGELLLLEHNQQRLYTIKAPKLTISHVPEHYPQASRSDNTTAFALLFFAIVVLSSYFWYLRKKAVGKSHFLYEQWANFDVNPATKSLSLYKRHNKSVEQILKISSIVSSELLLNDDVISTVSADSTQVFSNHLEENVLAIFAKEHRAKMLNDMHRKIQLVLVDEQKNKYLFCLYYRVGNMRHTKLKYSKVINKAIDWHWLFSQYINPESTEKRKIKVKPKREKSTPSPAKPQVNAMSNSIAPPSDFANKNDSHDLNNSSISSKLQPSTEDAANLDTQLVSALDKLVEMKKQGFLNDSEFNHAKAKILKDLANES